MKITYSEEEKSDWELFELLEGNLTAQEEEAILARIEEDSHLADEWALLQSTVLETPKMIFPNKSSLKKEAGVVVVPFFVKHKTLLFSIAASLVLLLAAYPIFNLLDSNSSTTVASALIDADQENSEPIDSETSDLHINEPLNTPAEVIADAVAEPIPAKNNIKIKSAKRAVGIEHPSNNAYVSSFPDLDLTSRDIQFSMINDFQKVTLPYAYAAQMDPSLFRTIEEDNYKGIRHAFNAGLYALTDPFRNTKISYGRTMIDNKPSLQVAYNGKNRQALAMLQLK
jgi:hypothetical protein